MDRLNFYANLIGLVPQLMVQVIWCMHSTAVHESWEIELIILGLNIPHFAPWALNCTSLHWCPGSIHLTLNGNATKIHGGWLLEIFVLFCLGWIYLMEECVRLLLGSQNFMSNLICILHLPDVPFISKQYFHITAALVLKY